jgi:hypothetical protein
MPISRVRRETTNDVTPYTPTSASKIASSSNRGAGRAWSLRAGRPVAARVDLANRIVHGMLQGPEATTPLCRSAGSGLENRQQLPAIRVIAKPGLRLRPRPVDAETFLCRRCLFRLRESVICRALDACDRSREDDVHRFSHIESD